MYLTNLYYFHYEMLIDIDYKGNCFLKGAL